MKQTILQAILTEFPQWESLDNDEIFDNYAELMLFLPTIAKYEVILTQNILDKTINSDKINQQIINLKLQIENGQNIWNRLSYSTFKSYFNLEKTIYERKRKQNIFFGKDLLYNTFYIHHLRLNETKDKDGAKLIICNNEINFVERKQNNLLYCIFDPVFKKCYFLDILSHDDLYSYEKLLKTIVFNSHIPCPIMVASDTLVNGNSFGIGFNGDKFKKLIMRGCTLLFNINNQICRAKEIMCTNGFTGTVDLIANNLKNSINTTELPLRFLYKNHPITRFYIIEIIN